MTGPMASPGIASPTANAHAPKGFFHEVASMLHTESAEEIAEAVITVCTRRGILHPELDEDLDDELRTQEIREVFDILSMVTDAVADGRIVPSGVHVDDEIDPDMAAVWESFVDDAADPETAAAAATMLNDGKAVPLGESK
ncbi:hypothetical protein [Mycolicibacterium aubagnense]|uniref:Uncharacterized protein n=1 Tax=Mycolicibacterium aubagnense TaxID=319707 RepID=A0ABM7IM47_9MYCO|nr:hypothetical protein [Mycolicibacterium aubagnense]TLH64248.1 hypothetical protein C1S80_12610 [Mycolicibacterium aubagnense]BBX87888.1 hypothetical protein MAUB_57610 [Mycolicibacterium aubagnense]